MEAQLVRRALVAAVVHDREQRPQRAKHRVALELVALVAAVQGVDVVLVAAGERERRGARGRARFVDERFGLQVELLALAARLERSDVGAEGLEQRSLLQLDDAHRSMSSSRRRPGARF